jgi:hypothetical protein
VTYRIMTLSITTISITDLKIKLLSRPEICFRWGNNFYTLLLECRYAECHYFEFHFD